MKAFNKVGDTMKLSIINFTGHCQSSWPIDYQLFFKSQYRLFAAFFVVSVIIILSGIRIFLKRSVQNRTKLANYPVEILEINIDYR
jgi:hypothetical protein